MRIIICNSCVVLFALIAMGNGSPIDSEVPGPKPQYQLVKAPELFEKFIQDFHREYKDAEDRKIHYDVFVKTLETVNRLNSDPNQGSATFDINQFSDYTDEEKKQMHGFRNE